MAESWQGKVATMMDRYFKGAENLCVRERLVLATLEKLGRIITGCDAEYAYHSVMKSLPPVETHGEAAVINFGRRNLWDQASLGWRGYVATDAMYLQEKMESKNDVVIVNRYASMLENLVEAIRVNFGKDVYINGGASGNELKIEGLDTFCQYTAGSTAAGDKVAFNSGTYHGISCALGQEGTWDSDLSTSPNTALATDWPEGQGSEAYDYWSAKLAKWDSTAWTTETTWIENCEAILMAVASWLRLTVGTSGQQLMCIMAGHMMQDLKTAFQARNRNLLPHKQSRDLGFTSVLQYEGLGLHDEFGVPVNTAFVWNFEKTELCSLAEDLLFKFGPEWSIKDLAWLVLAGFYGNLRVKSPKYFSKIFNFTASA